MAYLEKVRSIATRTRLLETFTNFVPAVHFDHFMIQSKINVRFLFYNNSENTFTNGRHVSTTDKKVPTFVV